MVSTNSLVGKPHFVLDRGSVTLDNYMYTDDDICRIARVTSIKAGKTKFKDDTKLLSWFLKHRHSSPIQFPEIVLYIKCPFPIREQWFRHRTGTRADVCVESTDQIASKYHDQQQFSGRYATYSPEVNIPPLEWMVQPSTSNFQISSDKPIADPETAQQIITESISRSVDDYQQLLSMGLARERARWVVPMAQYTEFYWKQDLWNLLDWLEKRRASGAQLEITAYAFAIEEIVKNLFPKTYAGWIENVEGVKLTKTEKLELLELLTNNNVVVPENLAVVLGG